MAESTYEMLGLALESNNSWEHKEMGTARLERDESDVKKLVTQFQRFDVFSIGPDLLSLCTKDVAPTDVKEALLSAEEWGKQAFKNFLQQRMQPEPDVGFHDSLPKNKSKTFLSLYTIQTKGASDHAKTFKADRDLFK